MTDEARFRSEGEAAHPGMQPVGAHHEMEGARRRPLEGYRDAVRGVGQARDGIVEDVLDVVAGGLVQDAHQVAADDLEVLRVDDPERAVEAGQPLPGGTYVGHPAGAGARGPGRVQDCRPPGHFDRRPAQVDGLAAVARRGRPFHDDRGEAEPPQPDGQRLPGHACPRDEHVPVPHGASWRYLLTAETDVNVSR